jgi:hypothetical protein
LESAGSDRSRHRLARLLIIGAAAVFLAGIPGSADSRVLRDYESTPGEGFEYVSPRPLSVLVSPRNNIAFRPGSRIDAHSLAAARFSVVGASSGPHDGALVLADDTKTIVFRPLQPFAPGEPVEVAFEGGIRTAAGEELPPLVFGFTVADVDPAEPWEPWLSEALSDGFPLDPGPESGVPGAAVQNSTAAACGPLPTNYPPIRLLLSNHPEPGDVFLSPFRNILPGHLVIVDNLGNPIFYRRLPAPSTDFKRQPDGRLTYFAQSFQGSLPKFYALDESYAVVDSFATGNGYRTDSHDLQLLPGGHALLMSYDPQRVRMDTVVAGGRTNALVTGLILQEIDAAKNVVFQWRSWDHFKITDANSPSAPLIAAAIDYVHGNAIELDLDGNLLLSSRHMNEITKIDRQTGEIIWRMGLHAKNNQFTFVNDTRSFSHQHDIRRLPSGHLTLFDNGNALVPPLYSRAVEYEVDEVAKRATRVWEFRNTPDTYGSFMGNVQRRPGGGTMIGWGGTDPDPKLTDLHADGTKAFELGMVGGTWTYRAFRFPWRTNLFVTDETSLDFGEVLLGAPSSRSVSVRNPSPAAITIDCAFSTDPAFEVLAPTPATLAPGEVMQIEVRFRPSLEGRIEGKLYVRSTTTTELIAQDVELAGTGVTNRPPDCGAARATPSELWPPNHELVPIAIDGVTDPDGDPVTIEVTSVTQDEDFLGSGDACPGAVVESGAVWVRSERAGPERGRVYQIGFTARDPSGAHCEGAVQVCVPHDRGAEDPGAGSEGAPVGTAGCEDDGQVVNSLAPCPEARRHSFEAGAAPGPLALRAGRDDGGDVTIEFALEEEGEVSLAVFDLAGRRIGTLASGRRGAGSQRVVWNAAGVSAGMYYCRIRTGSAAIVRPVLVVK